MVGYRNDPKVVNQNEFEENSIQRALYLLDHQFTTLNGKIKSHSRYYIRSRHTEILAHARQVKENGSWHRKLYTRPTIVNLYNKGMGGTDSGDQRVFYYRPRLKTRTWPQRIFAHFLNVAVTNAFIFTKHTGQCKCPPTHLAFRELLVNELLEDFWAQRQEIPAAKPSRGQSRKQWEVDPTRLAGLHFPAIAYNEKANQIDISNQSTNLRIDARNNARGRCILCTQKVAVYCEACDVYICIKNSAYETNCFREFHTHKKFENFAEEAEEDSESSEGEVSV